MYYFSNLQSCHQIAVASYQRYRRSASFPSFLVQFIEKKSVNHSGQFFSVFEWQVRHSSSVVQKIAAVHTVTKLSSPFNSTVLAIYDNVGTWESRLRIDPRMGAKSVTVCSPQSEGASMSLATSPASEAIQRSQTTRLIRRGKDGHFIHSFRHPTRLR